ncbi:MAG TPA: fatty acyl-AMP ligase [Vicinamibacterales bacterium]|nr:fatty acyl-AMP ligase [Vicinamibacterales bacterium]
MWNTFAELLAYRASSAPDLRGYRFLPRTGDPQTLDYRTLCRRAATTAAALLEHARVGDRALILLPAGLDFVVATFGCLQAGVIAVPSTMPHVGRTERRFDTVARIATDARPSVVMTTPALVPVLRAMDGPWRDVHFLTDLQSADVEAPPAAIDPRAPAIIQYSSGSTRTPKGVVLSQRNLLANIAAVHRKFQTTPASHGVIWLPPHHDMGLIGGVLGPLFGGFGVTLLSPVSFLQQPFRWLKAISDARATISGGPDSAYRWCVDRISDAQRASLDLSSWEVAFNGAEPIRPATLERFSAAFAPCGFRKHAFYPCYGLAEATLLVTGPDRTSGCAPAAAPDGRIGCGGPADGHEVRIVQPDSLRECPDGAIGEIWVRGPSVAAGYWNDAAETARAFGWMLDGRGPFMRTGDLGAVSGGSLFVTGRLKDAIVIAGRKYWAEDVEASLDDLHPDLMHGACAAFAVDVEGQERLAIVHEVKRHAAPQRHDDLVDAIRRRVADQWSLPVHAIRLLKPGALPRTTSGKPRRFVCRAALAASTLDVWTPTSDRAFEGRERDG